MNRIVLTQNEHGDLVHICADEEIAIYWIDPRTPHDRVYLYSAAQFGREFVEKELGTSPVGHANDGILPPGLDL